MAEISTSISLANGMTQPLMNIINSINNVISTLNTVNNAEVKIDTSSLKVSQNMLSGASAEILRWQEEIEHQLNKNSEAMQRFKSTFKATDNLQVSTVGIFEWEKSNMNEVFTTQGIERHKQEILSLQRMLNETNGIVINPTFSINNSAKTDIENLNERILNMKNNIKNFADNPVGLSTTEANAKLEQLRNRMRDILNSQNNLNSAMNKMDIDTINYEYKNLNNLVNGVEAEIRDNITAQNEFNTSINRGIGNSNGLLNNLKRIAAAYVGIQTAKAGINLSDTITQNTARLNLMNDGKQTTEDLQKMIFESSQKSRGNFLSTTDSIAKMGLMAPEAFNSNIELVEFMELINKQFKIAGTNAAGIDAAMLQLTQAMGAGVLRGEELNSVLEQAPIIVRNIAKYMNVPVGQIKNLAAEGKITSEIVKNAMFYASEEINKQFESIPKTFADISTQFKNDAMRNFQPIAVEINKMLNNDKVKTFLSNTSALIGKFISKISTGLKVLGEIGNFVYNNWSFIAPVISMIVLGMVAYNTALKIMAARTALSSGVTLMYNLALIAKNVLLGASNAALIATTSAQWGLNAAMLASPITWIVGGMMLFVGIIYLVVAAYNKLTDSSLSATGMIVSGFAAILGTVGNFAISIFNIFSAIGNFLINIFIDPIFAIKKLILDLTTTILDIVSNFSGIFDKIFGKDSTSKIEGLKGIIENKLNIEEPKNYGGDFKFQPINTKELMTNAYDKVANFNFGLKGTENENSQITGLLTKIANNTEDSNNTLDLTKEELKYMRDIAERDVINRYTTASITLDIKNNNNISNEMDIADVVKAMTDGITENALLIAEGNY